MSYPLAQFIADCRSSLQADTGEIGQEQVRSHLTGLLSNPQDLLGRLGNAKHGRHLIHHDQLTDMYVFAHIFSKEGRSNAHDHGPCWIIYGNVTGHTDMIEWRRIDDGKQEGHAELEKTREYRVKAGEAALFKKGAIHSTYHPDGDSLLVRVISGDMDSVWRHTFNPEKKIVKNRPPKGQAEAEE